MKRLTQFFLVAVLIGTVVSTAPSALAAPPDDLDKGIISEDKFGIRNDVVENGTTLIYDALDITETGAYTFDIAVRVDPNRIPSDHTPFLLGINSEWECKIEGRIDREQGMAIFRNVAVEEGTHGFTAAFRKGNSKKWALIKPTRHTWGYGTDKAKYVIKVAPDGTLIGGPRATEHYYCCPEGK